MNDKFVLYFASANKGKINSLQRDFAELDIDFRIAEMEIPEIRSEETAEIATKKVEYAYEKLKQPCIAQDGGFYIPALNGFPNAFVNCALETIGIEGILKLLEGKERRCEFRDTIAFIDKKIEEPVLFTAITRGTIAESPRGELQDYHW